MIVYIVPLPLPLLKGSLTLALALPPWRRVGDNTMHTIARIMPLPFSSLSPFSASPSQLQACKRGSTTCTNVHVVSSHPHLHLHPPSPSSSSSATPCMVVLSPHCHASTCPVGFVPAPVAGMGMGTILCIHNQTHAHANGYGFSAGTGVGEAMGTCGFTHANA